MRADASRAEERKLMETMDLAWGIKAFPELTTQGLYDILRLRSEVFVVEQNCFYQDPDGIDQRAWHLTGRTQDGELACYLRLIPPGGSHGDFGSLGRVVVAKRFRARAWPTSCLGAAWRRIIT